MDRLPLQKTVIVLASPFALQHVKPTAARHDTASGIDGASTGN
ncbi:hypothetical protein [Streptomyces sp. NPDC052036]